MTSSRFDMDAVPFTPITSQWGDEIIENIEALADGTGLDDGAIGQNQLSPGVEVQIVYANYATADSTTSQIPTDSSIPQNTEGKEFMSAQITPKSTTNILVIEIEALLSVNAADRWCTGAIFKDTDVNALKVGTEFQNASTAPVQLSIRHIMIAGTTSPVTFRFRAGSNNTGTLSFNAAGAISPIFGATVPKSNIKITEYKAS